MVHKYGCMHALSQYTFLFKSGLFIFLYFKAAVFSITPLFTKILMI